MVVFVISGSEDGTTHGSKHQDQRTRTESERQQQAANKLDVDQACPDGEYSADNSLGDHDNEVVQKPEDFHGHPPG
ncbi:hypothetical protein XACJJ10_2190002 [Xanthomonas citri pv. citri]|nr:hypothetical protein XAC40_1300013 [Xanthomonas citri pv. citri]CEH82568.1 hypothetical protein XAC3612_2740002 [Xanthomonas citri pv. citri]CEH99972.1 hypothetical protein XACG117_2450003 [Xanthomonas citri pv. citri]CEI36677.1 hypothetical protein XACJJ10_2190002 [Xanthomonas citri pv. citri]